MVAGLRVRFPDGRLQIDNEMTTAALVAKGTVTSALDLAISVTAQVPFIAWRCDLPYALTRTVNSGTSWEFHIVSRDWNPLHNLTYYVFDVAQSFVPTSPTGMNLYNSLGVRTFNSEQGFAIPVGRQTVESPNTDVPLADQEFVGNIAVYPAGRLYAVAPEMIWYRFEKHQSMLSGGDLDDPANAWYDEIEYLGTAIVEGNSVTVGPATWNNLLNQYPATDPPIFEQGGRMAFSVLDVTNL